MLTDPKPPMSAEEMAMRVVDSDSFSDVHLGLDAWEAEIRADEWRLADATIERLRAEVAAIKSESMTRERNFQSYKASLESVYGQGVVVHIGHKPTLEDVRMYHSKMTTSGFASSADFQGHRPYSQGPDSACYLCAVLYEVADRDTEIERLRAERDAYLAKWQEMAKAWDHYSSGDGGMRYQLRYLAAEALATKKGE